MLDGEGEKTSVDAMREGCSEGGISGMDGWVTLRRSSLNLVLTVHVGDELGKILSQGGVVLMSHARALFGQATEGQELGFLQGSSQPSLLRCQN